ncbi:hypothetical protein PHJA_001769900 [Phtheirospermum japonicum]|uniref:Uncharacterized protein n=1 Tax=Phtheirospermum japonicum TaxID=374723 RepID=A0A830CGS0_9LAMI|nr:hypothetical protein PHJA_001769900 [Phtheirospermum japonicum]
MPTFTAIAFDRLIESGASNSMVSPRNSPNSKIEKRHSTPNTIQDHEINPPISKLERGVTIPHILKLDKRKNGASSNTSTSAALDKKHHWTQISPALYATPESTPLPDSLSSFPPSPYIINHKRRGPRLMKSFSEYDVATWKQDEIKVVDENGNCVGNGAVANVSKDDSFISMKVSDLCVDEKEKHLHGACNDDGDMGNGPAGQNGVLKSLAFNSQEDGEVDDFVDPQDSKSVKSESEGNGGAEQPLINLATPLAEFYDAWEELSSENGLQIQMPDIESELREIRLSLLMEIEKRKQAEEALCNMRNQWQIIREKLSLVGLTFPADPTTLPDGEQQQPGDLVCQQVYLARFVSNLIGRGIAKAEVEMEMEAQIKLKNVEIARLWDRLHYYEAVNQEIYHTVGGSGIVSGLCKTFVMCLTCIVASEVYGFVEGSWSISLHINSECFVESGSEQIDLLDITNLIRSCQ